MNLIRIFFILLIINSKFVFAQTSLFPLQSGFAVVTSFGDSANSPPGPKVNVVTILDLNNWQKVPKNKNWITNIYSGENVGGWNVEKLGPVFGIAIDKKKNIYLTTFPYYYYWPIQNEYPFGSYKYGKLGGGGVYKIDGVTGEVVNFKQLPNNIDTTAGYAPGLGNICFDYDNNQLFVTNFEDGKIYRISLDGKVLSTFDPFQPDDNKPGFAPLSERVFGVAYKNSRVYYSRFVEEKTRPNDIEANQIWSVPIDKGDFIKGINSLEISIPSFGNTINYSYPVSDISFNNEGTIMLLAERTINTDGIQQFGHESRLLEYRSNTRFPGSWLMQPEDKFKVGDPRLSNTSCAGGVSFGTQTSNGEVFCDSIIWATGNSLKFYIGRDSSEQIYGLQGMPITGGTILNSVLVDTDANTKKYSKIQIGDVELFKECCITNSFLHSDTNRITIWDTLLVPIYLNNKSQNQKFVQISVSLDTTYLQALAFFDTEMNNVSYLYSIQANKNKIYKLNFSINPQKNLVGYIKIVPRMATTETLIDFSLDECYLSNPAKVIIDDCKTGGKLQLGIYSDTLKFSLSDTLLLPIYCKDYTGKSSSVRVNVQYDFKSFFPIAVTNKMNKYLLFNTNEINGSKRLLSVAFEKENKIGIDTLGYIKLIPLAGDTNAIKFDFTTDSCYNSSPAIAYLIGCGANYIKNRGIDFIFSTKILYSYYDQFSKIFSYNIQFDNYEDIELNLYDILGNHVKTILYYDKVITNRNDKNNFTVNSNPNNFATNYVQSSTLLNLPTGLYFLELKNGVYRDTKKIIISK